MPAEEAGKSIHICKRNGKKSLAEDQMNLDVVNVYA